MPWTTSFFALRTPLLPGEALDSLGAVASPDAPAEGLAGALAVDTSRTETALRALVARPDFAEALRLASPTLFDAVLSEAPGANTPTPRPLPPGARASLYAYAARAASRPTPFGLFAGVALGTWADTTSLRLSARLRRHTRLDHGWLEELLRALTRDLAPRLTWRATTTLTTSPRAYSYAASVIDPDTRRRGNDQVALVRTPVVDATLAAAPGTLAELARTVHHALPGARADEVQAFLQGLCDAGLLQSDLEVPVTGDDALGTVTNALGPHHPSAAKLLAALGEALRRLDTGVGHPARSYRAIEGALARLPARGDQRRLLHVDLHREGDLRLGPKVLAAIADAREVLARISPGDGRVLTSFIARFEDRYGEEERPLAEVVDPELGIGLDDRDGAAPSPLLRGLPLPAATPTPATFGPREAWMLRRAWEAGAGGEWRLDDQDLDALAATGARLANAHAFFGTLEAGSADAVDRGEFVLHVASFAGPSGVNLLGRFCHGDPALRAAVEAHLREEEALRPDVIHAEIVHQPEGRAGNVIARPRLRTWEIPYGGRGAAPAEHQIPVEDLRVSVVQGVIRLRSARLGREVVPRLTSAHNHATGDLPVYRFLGALTRQGVRTLAWSWGAVDALPALPRVTWCNLVLAPAVWAVEEADVRRLAAGPPHARVVAARALRARLRMPRRVALMEQDHVLPVDLESEVGLDVLHAHARGGRTWLRELGGASPLEGPEGRYAQEIVVPFVRRADPPANAARVPAAETPAAHPAPAAPLAPSDGPAPPLRTPRRFPPGSPWLYAKVYQGPLLADGVLAEAVAPLVDRLRGEGNLERWFFVRFADPEPHLRVRLRVRAPGRALELLHEATAPLLAARTSWRLALDTYQPELERYGGDDLLPVVEQVFEADADAFLALLASIRELDGDARADAVWRAAVTSVHGYLDDADVPLAQRVVTLRAWSARWSAQAGVTPALRAALHRRYREVRPAVEGAVAAPEPWWTARSARVRALLARGAAASLPSIVHMAMNRTFPSLPNLHEAVVYDFLARAYHGRAARGM